MKAARKRAGVTQEVVAERMGVSTGQISRWENGVDGIPSGRLPKLVEVYESSVEELLTESEIPISTEVPPSNAQPLRYEGAADVTLPRDIPIYGTSLGAPLDFDGKAIEQTMLNTGETIGHLPRPTVLNGQKAAYGLYVQGSSMEPRHENGDTIFVQDSRHGRPPRIGDDVVVYLRDVDDDDGERATCALVKRLARKTAHYIELEQFNPPVIFRIEVEKVIRVDRVIPWRELLS